MRVVGRVEMLARHDRSHESSYEERAAALERHQRLLDAQWAAGLLNDEIREEQARAAAQPSALRRLWIRVVSHPVLTLVIERMQWAGR